MRRPRFEVGTRSPSRRSIGEKWGVPSMKRKSWGRGGGEIKAVRWKLLFFLENHVPAARDVVSTKHCGTRSRTTDDDGAWKRRFETLPSSFLSFLDSTPFEGWGREDLVTNTRPSLAGTNGAPPVYRNVTAEI